MIEQDALSRLIRETMQRIDYAVNSAIRRLIFMGASPWSIQIIHYQPVRTPVPIMSADLRFAAVDMGTTSVVYRDVLEFAVVSQYRDGVISVTTTPRIISRRRARML